MSYVKYEIFGKSYEFLVEDVLDCVRLFGCSYEDALWQMAYMAYLEEV